MFLGTATYNYVEIEDKSFQWLGATVVTEPKSGFIAACAPRYVYKVSSGQITIHQGVWHLCIPP